MFFVLLDYVPTVITMFLSFLITCNSRLGEMPAEAIEEPLYEVMSGENVYDRVRGPNFILLSFKSKFWIPNSL